MGLYGSFFYGSAFYGSAGLPSSPDFDVFDFCYPTELMMTSLLSYPGVTPKRYGGAYGFFNASSDYCMMSNDELDSGFRIDTSIPTLTYTLQFSILPTTLPEDFSSTSTNRVFVAIFNPAGKSVGLLLSESGGIALSTDGLTYTQFYDSADIFAEGADYYVFRITVNESTNRANLYVTRKDVLNATGVHTLRYTFTPPSTPASEPDNIRVEVVGTSGDPTQVCLDCLRLASTEVIPNRRPVAVITEDQSRILGQYGSFDGTGSYDPDSPPQPLRWWWSLTNAPDSSSFWVSGTGSTPMDASGYTNIITGAADTFSGLLENDLMIGDVGNSRVMRVASDGSWVALVNDVMVANSTPSWSALTQSCWGGSRVPVTNMTDVLERRTSPPGAPTVDDKYLIVATASSGWTGHEGEVATYVSGDPALEGSWSYEVLASGLFVFVEDEYEAYKTAGSGIWAPGDPKPWDLNYWEGCTASIAEILLDVTGLSTVELMVNDGVRDSLPAEGLLNIFVANVPLGYTPDLSFEWNYLPDIWSVVETQEIAETVWSAGAQLSTDELMRAWQHDYGKSLLDIQRTFQRRWLNHDPWYEEPNYEDEPATIRNDINEAGYAILPTPAGPEVDPERTFVLDTGALPAGTSDQDYVILDGLAYHITRTRDDNLITSDTLPTTDRPNYWMIRPTVTSVSTNFSSVGVQKGDAAVFEVQTSEGDTTEVSAYVWGARGAVLAFDDTNLSSYLASDAYTVRFKGVLRRSLIQVDDSVSSMPRLQEVIALSRVDDAPDPLEEGHNFRVETATTVESVEINTINMKTSWFPEELVGYTGYTDSSNHEYFYDGSADFETQFGEGADLRDYELEITDGSRYRLYQVISATQLELFDQALELDLTGQRWKVRKIEDPPDHLWAELTHLDNKPTIEANFGRLISFTLQHLEERTDNLDYLSAVQGLWYYVWHGRTLFRTRVGCQIILGLPFAEVDGTIIDIQEPFDATRSRILIQDADNPAILRSYFYPSSLGIATNPETAADYVLGDTVEQFAPLSEGVTVVDYVEDPDWFADFVGAGDFYEAQKCHTWGVLIDAEAFDLLNLLFLVDYLRQYKPDYTDPFFVVVKSLIDYIDVGDQMVLGPVVPGTYVNRLAEDLPVTVPPGGWDFSWTEGTEGVTVPGGGWDFSWIEGAGGEIALHTATVPANTYSSVQDFLDELETQLEAEIGEWTCVVSSRIVTITREDEATDDTISVQWAQTDDGLSSYLGYAESESFVGSGGAEPWVLTAISETTETHTVTVPSGYYESIPVFLAELETQLELEGGTWTCSTSVLLMVVLTRGDTPGQSYIAEAWSSTNDDLSSYLGYAESEDFVDGGAPPWTLTGTSQVSLEDVETVPYSYPDDWPAYDVPEAWADSPWEVLRAAITDHYPTTPPVPPMSHYFGGLRMLDSPGIMPDGWSGNWGSSQPGTHSPTISEGSFAFDDTDESGHHIHRFDAYLTAVNLLQDGDCENSYDPDDPSSPWSTVDLVGGGSVSAIKSTTQAHGGSQSIVIASTDPHIGIEQPVGGLSPTELDAGYQVGARLWIYLWSGQAYIRLLDQDSGGTVLAEWRHASHYQEWHQISLHNWELSTRDTNYVTLQILTGPGGSSFYVDDIGVYTKEMSWEQWGYDRALGGRTGGYTTGGLPDDVVEFMIALEVS